MNIYCSWVENKANDNCFKHPNTDNKSKEIDIDFTFYETCYSKVKNPVLTTFIGHYSYPDTKTINEINQYLSGLANFQIQDKTEEEINTLLLDFYGVDGEGNPYVSVSDYIFTDNRPQETI